MRIQQCFQPLAHSLCLGQVKAGNSFLGLPYGSLWPITCYCQERVLAGSWWALHLGILPREAGIPSRVFTSLIPTPPGALREAKDAVLTLSWRILSSASLSEKCSTLVSCRSISVSHTRMLSLVPSNSSLWLVKCCKTGRHHFVCCECRMKAQMDGSIFLGRKARTSVVRERPASGVPALHLGAQEHVPQPL